MIEPWTLDWGANADWSDVAKVEARFPALLAHFKSHWANKDMLVLDDDHLTYGEIEAKSAILARQLIAAGVAKGTRIGLLLQSDRTYIISYMAVTRIGAVAVNMPSLATAAEIQKIARHGDLHMLFAPHHYMHHDYVQRVADAFPSIAGQRAPYRLPEAPYLRSVWFWGGPAPAWAKEVDLTQEPEVDDALLAEIESEVHASDPACIIYTSGSTADPKGVIHSQGNFVRQGMKVGASFKYKHDERVYAGMPFFWVGGLCTTLLAVMSVGGTLLASKKTGPELLDFLEHERMTGMLAWPHMMRNLANDPTFTKRDWSAMRNGLLWEAFPPDKRPKDAGLMPSPFGMTETSAIYTVAQRNLPEHLRGSVGPLMRGIAARLVDGDTGKVVAVIDEGDPKPDTGGKEGILHLRSDVMMLGMVKRENADVFTADGYYVSGDVCSFREGHMFYQGRADDLIKAAGANVSPREVEAVLLKIPGVASANATGVPDAKRGTIVAAAVVPQPGAKLDPEALRKEAAKSLASYKVPRLIAILEGSQLPVLPSSKVDRRGLVRLLQEIHEKTAS